VVSGLDPEQGRDRKAEQAAGGDAERQCRFERITKIERAQRLDLK
jgi:hypothetical protein